MPISVEDRANTTLSKKVKKELEAKTVQEVYKIIIQREEEELLDIIVITQGFEKLQEYQRQDNGWTFLENNLSKESIDKIAGLITVTDENHLF